ncbi:erythromycin esterase family protein [Balneolaceae bacterium ANBcel3]|nr:erythromycin esterase family protein [Balneolaceae bacterium ANBcel3]
MPIVFYSCILLFLLCPSGLKATDRSELEDAIQHVKKTGMDLNDPAILDHLLERAGETRLVLLGEASHGTSEYYTWRAEISKRLIMEHGFDFIIVEGDWPVFFHVNAFVKHKREDDTDVHSVLSRFQRWPQWMWANEEIRELVNDLYDFNTEREAKQRAGLYGMDVYGYEKGMNQVLSFIEKADPENLRSLRNRYRCFSRYSDMQSYLQMVHQSGEHCGEDIEWVRDYLEEQREVLIRHDSLGYVNARQNSRMAVYAERHIRANLEQGPASWNHRADHFYDATQQMLELYGSESKGIVWAHNTHVGDARATEMRNVGMRNIGQLARENLGEEAVYIIGFGTYRGEVLAGRQWEGRMEKMTIPPAVEQSYEYIMKQAGISPMLLAFDHPTEHRPLLNPRGNRAVGVVYQPENDHRSNFVQTILPVRYNAFIFFETTGALTPLE